jgi:hypothetical protein
MGQNLTRHYEKEEEKFPERMHTLTRSKIEARTGKH